MEKAQKTKIAGRLVLSIVFSVFILSLIFHLVTSLDRDVNKGLLFYILRSASFKLLLVFFMFTLLQAFFRAWRYRLFLVSGGEENAPNIFHMFMVTIIRNMFVDFFPVRIGELSYVALLSRRYRIKASHCFSSLGISFFFDFLAIAFLFLILMIHYALKGDLHPVFLRVLTGAGMLVILSGVFLFFGLKQFYLLFRYIKNKMKAKRYFNTFVQFIESMVASLDMMKNKKVFIRATLLSLLIRGCKYAGLYFAFLAVAGAFSPELAEAAVSDVLVSLVSAEGAAGMPMLSFMGFGPYEAGGLAALTILGFSAADSMLSMLAIHIFSQIFDYMIGLTGIIVFLFIGYKRLEQKTRENRNTFLKKVSLVLLFLCALSFLFMEMRNIEKLGAFAAPPKGEKIAVPLKDIEKIKEQTKEMKGFIVWSTNREGSHDIFMLKLPSLLVSRITDHPYTEYFPRVSPDGKSIVFCRSQSEWVSQRDTLHWDVILKDLQTGKETFIAANANKPTWSEDGKSLYFQYKDSSFVKYDIQSSKMQILFEVGRGNIPDKVFLKTPSFSDRWNEMAVTLRGAKYMTALIPLEGDILEIGSGCQIAWSPDSSFLYYVEKENIWKYTIMEREKKMWLSLKGEYNHQYFPKLDRTGEYMVLGACAKGHEHDTADYEIFLWKVGTPETEAMRITFHTGNDNWPDIYLEEKKVPKVR